MSFGFEEKKVQLPYVESQNAKHGVPTPYPRFKYHKQRLDGVIVNDAIEEAALGEGWADSVAEFGIETAPSYDKNDPVAVALAKARAAKAAK